MTRYQSGFANDFSTEAVAGALPVGRNSPQRPPLGLYPEQLNGSAFTAPRAQNLRTWTYRIRPSVLQAGPFVARGSWSLAFGSSTDLATDPNPLRWGPPPVASAPTEFLEGIQSVCGNGSVLEQRGAGIHLYSFNRSMESRFFYSADGEFLFVPWDGTLRLRTELGELEVPPGHIACVPRGVKFQVCLAAGAAHARGYVCENYGQPFRLPELGPIGANGLANRRDFETPVAAYEERVGDFELVAKFGGRLFSAPLAHSPLDVVGWHGNYAPYRYDLARFNTIGSISFDHPDPSIFTVLTSPSDLAGTANLDFVIFPPRWLVGEDTFRPPYFHRNIMSEYMGLVKGEYDAKSGGFLPGGGSLHNAFTGHGPDAETFAKASAADLKPHKLANTMAFMLESRYVWHPTEWALQTPLLEKTYRDCWQGLRPQFKKP